MLPLLSQADELLYDKLEQVHNKLNQVLCALDEVRQVAVVDPATDELSSLDDMICRLKGENDDDL